MTIPNRGKGLRVSKGGDDQANAVPYAWLDAMRALAAFAVVLTHSRDFLMTDYPGNPLWAPFYLVTGVGHQAVIVFFVLSGFWIGKSVLRGIDAPGFWTRYGVARLTRLWIVLIPALLIGGLLDTLGGVVWNLPFYHVSQTHSLPPLRPDALSPLTLLGNLAFLQTILVDCFGTNGPLWSLACEFWFYLWFPALVTLGKRRPTWALASLGIAILVPDFIGYFAIWLMGVALHLGERKPAALAFVARAPRLLLGLALALFAATLVFARSHPGQPSDIVLGVGFAVLLAVLLNLPRSPFAAPRALVFYGGKVSYSLYAVHFPILAFIVAISGLPRSAPGLTSVALVIGLALTLAAIAWVFAALTEARTDTLRRAILRRRSAA